MTIETQIRDYLTEYLLFGDDTIEYTDDDSLLDAGIVDSVAVMELIMFAEKTFDISVEDQDITPENFDSVSRLAGYIRLKMNHAGA
jgi:acyl carrier protein